MAAANPLWRAPRIHGELQMLGIEISERTVSRLLRQLPRRPSQTWKTFLHNHLGQMLSMDYQQPSSVARVTLIRLSDIRSRASLRRRQTLNPGVPEKTLVVVRETSCWQLEILRLPWPLPSFLSA